MVSHSPQFCAPSSIFFRTSGKPHHMAFFCSSSAAFFMGTIRIRPSFARVSATYKIRISSLTDSARRRWRMALPANVRYIPAPPGTRRFMPMPNSR